MFFRIRTKSGKRIREHIEAFLRNFSLVFCTAIGMTKAIFDVILDSLCGRFTDSGKVFGVDAITTPLSVDGGGQLT
jgi:hypothetical protein